MKKGISSFLFSFPVQLLVLHFKKHHFLLFFWLFLFLLATSTIGSHYGVNYLYLDPEYMGKVSYRSFFLLGLAFGGFFMAWNITSYILNAFRFPFLATLKRPFGIYCLNNSTIPLIFSIVYCLQIVEFQREDQLQSITQTLMNLLGLASGAGIVLLLAGVYFFSTNKDIFQLLGFKKVDIDPSYQMIRDAKVGASSNTWRVDTYLNVFMRPRIVRGVEHYDPELVMSVYKQHHTNAVFVEISGLGLLIALGLLIDYPAFIIPAAASLLLLFALLLVLTGAFSYWIRGWRAAMYILLFLILNFLMKYDLFNYKNKAYGMDYTTSAEYSRERLEGLSSKEQITKDRAHWTQILQNWQSKNQRPPLAGDPGASSFNALLDGASAGSSHGIAQVQRGYNKDKPKLVLINVSGGGMRAALFATRMMQLADSLTNGQLMEQTFLISGASGGMLGAAYYRELSYQKKLGNDLKPYSLVHPKQMGKDLLNPLAFAFVVNDMFYPWQKFEVNGHEYRKDRGYVFEQHFHQNTNNILDKPLLAYRQPEFDQDIPLMIMAPTIINDERKCFISPQPVSWLTRPSNLNGVLQQPIVDGIDFCHFFEQQDAEDLSFGSALRMNATFPYILPNVWLPTEPLIEVMDAGIRDNFGTETATRFIHNFRNWLMENTSGVVLVEIRGHEQFEEIRDLSRQSFLEKLLNPITNLYSNWNEVQDFQHDFLLDYADEWIDDMLTVLVFEYKPAADAKKAAVSWHLTRKETSDILNSAFNPHNSGQMQQLQELLSNP